MTKLTYHNLIEQLKKRVPEFTDFQEEEAESLILFGSLVHYLIDNAGNEEVIQKAADFISDMAELDDLDVKMLLEDVFINIYSLFEERNIPAAIVTDKLRPGANARYNEVIAFWLRANNQT